MGWLAPPHLSRPSRIGQSVYVNRRHVFSLFLSSTIKHAYGTRLATDRYPLFLIHLFIDPARIDVNVHPQKTQVRFQQEDLLRFEVRSAVEKTFSAGVSPNNFLDIELPPPSFPFHAHEVDPEISFRLKEVDEPPMQTQLPLGLELRAIGVFSFYLLVDGETVFPDRPALLFFDLPAIEATLWFERLVVDSTPLILQQLLIPITLSFSKAHTTRLLADRAELEQWGLSLHPIGETTFSIEAIPSFCSEDQVADLLQDWLEENEIVEKNSPLEEKRKTKLATMLIRQARRKKKAYMVEEAKQLVHALLQLQTPFFAPGGSPTVYKIGKDEIATRCQRAP